MKVKQLIEILEKLEPEANISILLKELKVPSLNTTQSITLDLEAGINHIRNHIAENNFSYVQIVGQAKGSSTSNRREES